MENKNWLIWSNEHGAWWRPARNGYTRSRAEAGRYSTADALQIVRDANAYTTNEPNEAMVLDESEAT